MRSSPNPRGTSLAASPGGVLQVLTFHRIDEPGRSPGLSPCLISASPSAFEREMRALSRRGHVVSIEQVCECAATGRPMPPRSLLITFDDAYRDFGDVAWPILKRYRLPATLFVPTAYPGNPHMEFWWDRLYRALACAAKAHVTCSTLTARLPIDSPATRRRTFRTLRHHLKSLPHSFAMRLVDEMCDELNCPAPQERAVHSWDELRGLAADGVVLAPHSRTHPILTMIPREEAWEEIRGSRDDLDREIGRSVPAFAYPAGGHTADVEELVREAGYQLAFTTVAGGNDWAEADRMRLRRTNISPRMSWPAAIRLALTRGGGAVANWRQGGGAARPGLHAGLKVAYIMSRFPKLTETFVLDEMLAVERQGVPVEVYPLLRERETTVHADAQPLVARAHFHPFISIPIILAQWHFLRRRPGVYFRTWWEVLRGTWGSRNFFIGALGILPKAVRFAYEMEREGIGHVHAHFANHPAVAALVIHRLTGIPFSFTAHAHDLHVERRMLGAKVRAAKFAVSISEFNRRIMAAECDAAARRKIRVIHCGVEPGLFVRDRRPEPARPLEIVCVASLLEVKGHRYLIDACHRLAERGVNFRCRLIGDGELRQEIEGQIAALGLQDRVLVLGGRVRTEVIETLATSDVAVLTSVLTATGKREGIPVALMEAMAAGLPVVASDISGIPELVEDGRTGSLVPPRDREAIANALETLARDRDLCARMGDAGREKVLRDFNQQTSARELVKLFAGNSIALGSPEDDEVAPVARSGTADRLVDVSASTG